MTDARQFLLTLKDKPIHTVTGRENRVLHVGHDTVLVWTTRSPAGQPVPISWVQDALDRLEHDGEVEISVESVRYRSAFIGAMQQQLPGAHVVRTIPPEVRLGPRVS
jgi:hypothetical protein